MGERPKVVRASVSSFPASCEAGGEGRRASRHGGQRGAHLPGHGDADEIGDIVWAPNWVSWTAPTRQDEPTRKESASRSAKPLAPHSKMISTSRCAGSGRARSSGAGDYRPKLEHLPEERQRSTHKAEARAVRRARRARAPAKLQQAPRALRRLAVSALGLARPAQLLEPGEESEEPAVPARRARWCRVSGWAARKVELLLHRARGEDRLKPRSPLSRKTRCRPPPGQ
jgi:hypothetical protein